MAYDEKVAQRVREAIGPRPDVNEIRMFGGLAFVRNGNMAVGVIGSELMVRVGRQGYNWFDPNAWTQMMQPGQTQGQAMQAQPFFNPFDPSTYMSQPQPQAQAQPEAAQ